MLLNVTQLVAHKLLVLLLQNLVNQFQHAIKLVKGTSPLPINNVWIK